MSYKYGCDYLEAKFPASQYEDREFDMEDLYDGIAYAYEDGHKDGVTECLDVLESYLHDIFAPISVENTMKYLREQLKDYVVTEKVTNMETKTKSHNDTCKKLIEEMNPNIEVNVKRKQVIPSGPQAQRVYRQRYDDSII